MTVAAKIVTSIMLATCALAHADDMVPDASSDILVTFENSGAKPVSGGFSAPYTNRKRYAIAATAQRDADNIADEYALAQVDHWPIKSLSVYCFVYRLSAGQNRESILARLNADIRVESAQPLQEFETGMTSNSEYNDTYVNLQHGLDVMGITEAHRHSRGEGVRIAIVDSNIDFNHEDLDGRLNKVFEFSDADREIDNKHGTAIVSIIGAHTNNAKGIAGVAPAAELDLFVSCWAVEKSVQAICDSFTLAKALDTLVDDPPHILNLSLTGPFDNLLARLLEKLLDQGVVIVAARPSALNEQNSFPAGLDRVIGVSSSQSLRPETESTFSDHSSALLYAPGEQIMVAIPGNAYDFRSGSSLATAHVSGIVALLLSIAPELSQESVVALLAASQQAELSSQISVHACAVLHLADRTRTCMQIGGLNFASELVPET